MEKKLLNSFKGIEEITWIPQSDKDALCKLLSERDLLPDSEDEYINLTIQHRLANYILAKIETIQELLDKKAYRDIYVYLTNIDVVYTIADIYTYAYLDLPASYGRQELRPEYQVLIDKIIGTYNKIKELTNTILENVTNSKDYTFEKIVIFKLYCLQYLVNYDCQDKHRIPFDNTNELISYIEDIAGMTVEECKGCYKFVQFNRLPSEEIEAFKKKIKDTNMKIFKEPIHKFIAENF